MKTFANGQMSESSGEPLDHDEWLKAQQKEHARLAKEKAARTRASAAPAAAAAEADDDEDGAEEEEPTFHGKPLSAFDEVPDDRLTEQDGIGEATAGKIIDARKARARRASR